jgi:N-acetylmuramoyl-L-alanine amidase
MIHDEDGTEVTLRLTQGVPFRVYTLANPPRLVLDFAEVNFADLSADEILPEPGAVQAVRFGALRPGWSRMIADMAEPMLPQDIGLNSGEGFVQISMRLEAVDQDAFLAASGAPSDAAWAEEPSDDPIKSKDDNMFTVVLDAGHGGIDPGAERGGLVEKVIVLDFARELRDMLRRAGLNVEMTRDSDVFVALEARTALAHRVSGDVFVSIHADVITEGQAEGATVYTLSERASDAASAELAARHNRSDLLAGVDLTGTDDEVTSVLLDLTRRETQPRSDDLARTIIEGMAKAGGPMNNKPWRTAGFSVLKSADIPSVLVEIGFLSSERDRKNLADPIWRSVIAAGLADAILAWRDADAARAGLVRQ